MKTDNYYLMSIYYYLINIHILTSTQVLYFYDLILAFAFVCISH